MQPIQQNELWHAQAAIIVAIILQFTIATDLESWLKYVVATLEILLVIAIGFTAPRQHSKGLSGHRSVAFLAIGLISFANIAQLILIINQLFSQAQVQGKSLLVASLAIFITNIIMFSLWYWELDSPGLTRTRNIRSKPNFLFTQNSDKSSRWQPTYFDYLYLSITNSTAFSPTDTMPKTHKAKALMSVQAIVALLTIVLVTARAVNILN